MPLSALALQAAPSLIQSGVGLAQSIFGGIGAHKAERALEREPTPFYNPNKGIQDYYQEALNRYNTSPYASMMYQQAQNRIAQSQAAGIGALQDRRSALGGVGAIVGQGERALGQVGVQAENMRRQDFGTLGRAAEMKRQDDLTGFQYNKLLPYEKRMSILGAKAGGANRMLSAGMQNVFQGLSGAGQIAAALPYNPSGSAQPYATYNQALADTGGGYSGASPASDIPYISPASATQYINPNISPLAVVQ